MIKKILILPIIFLFYIKKVFAEWTVFCPNWDCWLTTEWIKENLPKWVIKSDSIIEVIFAYIDFFMPFLSVFWFALLVYAGFSYIFKDSWMWGLAEDPMKIIQNVVIWFIIVFLSYSIVALMVNLES
jgi:hypothetical protein